MLKAVTISRNYRIKEQQQKQQQQQQQEQTQPQQHQLHSPHSSEWDHQYTDLIEIRKPSGTQNNNNNDNAYPSNDNTSQCIGCGTSKCSKDDINRSRSISMQRSGHGPGTSAVLTHCFDDQPVAKSQRSHLHRSRSKTVSTSLGDSTTSRCDSIVATTNPLRLSKRKTSQVRCPQSSVVQLQSMERRPAQTDSFTEVDLLNGNILDNTISTDSTTVTPRIICRNRIRPSIKCTAQSQLPCSKVISGSVSTTLIKRGKRTLSSTQIEREKSDEKNIKLKKHAVLRSVSPIIVASTARGSIKKIIHSSNTK